MFVEFYLIVCFALLNINNSFKLYNSIFNVRLNPRGIGCSSLSNTNDDIPPNELLTTTDEFENIANWCAKETVHKTVKFTDKNWFASLSMDSITKLTVHEVPSVSKTMNPSTSSVTAMVLPSSYSWPTFYDAKQSETDGKSVVILKKAPMILNNTRIVDILLNGRKVGLVGHPGVGKSTELNIVLIDLFRALMAGKITTVFHRVKRQLYRYHCSEIQGVKYIKCEKVARVGDSLNTLWNYFEESKLNMPTRNPSAVLVLELEESESDPTMIIPTLVALSSRDVETQLKTWDKANSVSFVVRPTHTPEELLVLATALFQLPCKSQFLSNLGLPSSTCSVDDVHQKVKERMEIVGPLAREVLTSEQNFNKWKKAMEGVSEITGFLEMKESLNEFSLPKTAKYYLTPDEHGKLHFLSGHVIEKILKSTKERHRHHVAELGYAWQAAEYIVKKYCVLNGARNGTAVCKAWDFNAWEYFNNPEPGESLSRKHELNSKKKAEIIKKITNHTHEAVFDGSLLRMSAEQLDRQCVYSSSVHTMSIGEFFVVGGNGEMILFQTSTVDPSKHSINISELRKWVAAVKPTSITIIFFTDWCEKRTTRVTLLDENEESLSDRQVSERLFGIRNPPSFKSYIVRCGIYNSDNVSRYIMSGDTTTLDNLMDKYIQLGEDKVQFRRVSDELTVEQITNLLKDNGVQTLKKNSKKRELVDKLLFLVIGSK